MYRQEYLLKLQTLKRIEEEAQNVIDIEKTNPEQAFSMWRDLLCDYSAYLHDEQYIEILIDNLLSNIRANHCRYIDKYTDGQIMMDRVIPYMIKFPEIPELIYRVSGRAGCPNDYSIFSAICLACFIVSNQAENTYKIIEFLSKNKDIKDIKRQGHVFNYINFSVGKFLIKTYDYVNTLINENDEKKYNVTDNVKQALINSLYLFDDKTIKAECMIPIMAIIGYDYKKD
ncbi:MAG: hypothetical protein IJJ56_04975 [Prevotella sp.]|nr:hypothetical protein [Prevotella sp.]